MNNIIQITDKHYQSFINEVDTHSFFLNLTDYVKYLFENEKIKPLLDNLLEQKTKEYKKLDDFYEQGCQELDCSKKRLLEIIDENGLMSDEILELLKKWKQLGITYFVAHPTDEKGEILFEIAKIINKTGKEELLKEFVNPNPIFSNINGDYIFAKSLIDLNICKAAIKEKMGVEIWGVLYYLLAAEKAIHFHGQLDNRLLEIPEDGRPYWQRIDEGVDMLHFVYEWRQITDEGQVRWSTGGRPFWFKADKFKLFITRFHNYLLKELSKQENTLKQKILSFDNDDSLLYFQGKEILIAKSKNTDPHYLLQTLFKDPKKLWCYDEISADWGNDKYNKEKWKKFYNAAKKVNEKVAVKTTADDFLETSKMTVNINKKYLSGD